MAIEPQPTQKGNDSGWSAPGYKQRDRTIRFARKRIRGNDVDASVRKLGFAAFDAGGGSSKRLTEESRPAIMDDELSRQKAEGDIP